MTMGDRIKSKRTLRNATYPTDNKDSPTGGQPAPAETSWVDGNKPERFRLTKRTPPCPDRTSFRSG
jgi:hypothetical protein